MLPEAIAFSAPEATSPARSGYMAHIGPYSEMCRKVSVPPRWETDTSMLEPLASSRTPSRMSRRTAGRIFFSQSGRLSYAYSTLLRKNLAASPAVWATTPALVFFLNSAMSRARMQAQVVMPCWRDFSARFNVCRLSSRSACTSFSLNCTRRPNLSVM